MPCALRFGIIAVCLLLLYLSVMRGWSLIGFVCRIFRMGFWFRLFPSILFTKGANKSQSSVPPAIGRLATLVLWNTPLPFRKPCHGIFTMRFSLLVVLGGIILFFWERNSSRRFSFLWPSWFLWFPFLPSWWNRVTFPMSFFASKVAAGSLIWLGFRVSQGGEYHPAGKYFLRGGGGLFGDSSLISLLALFRVFAYFSQNTTWKRVGALSFQPFRLPSVAIARPRCHGDRDSCPHYGDKVAPRGFFHGFSSGILFVVALCLFVCLFLDQSFQS